MRSIVALFSTFVLIVSPFSGALAQDLRTLQEASQFAVLDDNLVAPAGTMATPKLLSFAMERQLHSNWCWAANSKSVSAFYSSPSTWSQCKIAGAELNSDCCRATSDRSCNKTWYLDRALRRTSNYDETPSCLAQNQPCLILKFNDVAREIDKGHVVGIRIGWAGKGGHFIAIYGYQADATGSGVYYVDDPIYGKSAPSENVLKHSYQFTGSWTHSYYTRPEPAVTSLPGRFLPAGPLRQSILTAEPAKIEPTRIKFKLAPIDERYGALIEQAHPFLDIGRSQVQGLKEKRSVLAVPHPVYVAELSQLANSSNPLPEKPVGTRILKMADGEVLAAFDVKTEEGRQSLIGSSNHEPFVAALSDGLKNATSLSERTSETPELRLLTAPALYFEALWLHYRDAVEDTFVPILSLDMPLNRPMSRSQLIEALRGLAQERLKSESLGDTHAAP